MPEDFRSDEAAGRYIRELTEEASRRRRGFSVWSTFEGAAAIARQYGHLFGYFVAEIVMPGGTALEPFSGSNDHMTAYGDPGEFARSVIYVVDARVT